MTATKNGGVTTTMPTYQQFEATPKHGRDANVVIVELLGVHYQQHVASTC
jgi:hypothetical protein